jgi:RNA polymerase sigma factor (sigma-70 family)
MDTTLAQTTAVSERNRKLAEIIGRERGRLLSFIRHRLPDPTDAEDVLQDVFYELVNAYRLPQPIEQVGAWLFRVARNRIIDRFRRKRPTRSLSEPVSGDDDDTMALLWELLPAADADLETAYARALMLEELDAALTELPVEQRTVFIAHELEGRSFKDLAAESGIAVNTLLARKRYAVQYLRRRLQAFRDDFMNV